MSQLKFVRPDEIEVSLERQRQEFKSESMAELKASIENLGILQPVVVSDPNPDDLYQLVAGERRLRAMSELIKENKQIKFGPLLLDEGFIPIISVQNASPDLAFEMELDENLKRVDLTWQERTKALAKLHSLRIKQQGTQTTGATAEEAHVGRGTAEKALVLARHLDNPEVAAAKDMNEAMRIVKRQVEAAHRVTLAQRFDTRKTEHTLIMGDFLELIQQVPDRSFDIILTDPPYGVGANQFGEQSATGHSYDDSEEYFTKLLLAMQQHFDRICKPDAVLMLFCDIRYFPALTMSFELDGWKCRRRPLIWDKVGTGMLPVPDYEPRNSYECIFYAYRGKRSLIKKGAPDVLSYAPPKKIVHAAQKPVELLVDLLSRYAVAGDAVFDGFCGSGSVFPACSRLRLKATGWEKDEAQYNNALHRLSEDPNIREETSQGDVDDVEI